MRRADATGADAQYVFSVRFGLAPAAAGVAVEPATFETTVFRDADPPGESGWLFFRDNLWRGEVSEPDHFRELTEDLLGVPVESVSFSELRTSDAYFDELKGAIAADLDSFGEETVEAVVSKYLGSSVRVVD